MARDAVRECHQSARARAFRTRSVTCSDQRAFAGGVPPYWRRPCATDGDSRRGSGRAHNIAGPRRDRAGFQGRLWTAPRTVADNVSSVRPGVVHRGIGVSERLGSKASNGLAEPIIRCTAYDGLRRQHSRHQASTHAGGRSPAGGTGSNDAARQRRVAWGVRSNAAGRCGCSRG